MSQKNFQIFRSQISDLKTDNVDYLKKPPWKKFFFDIFVIHLSSRYEKRCQMLQRLFWLFQCSKNPQCKTFIQLLIGFSAYISSTRFLLFRSLRHGINLKNLKKSVISFIIDLIFRCLLFGNFGPSVLLNFKDPKFFVIVCRLVIFAIFQKTQNKN